MERTDTKHKNESLIGYCIYIEKLTSDRCQFFVFIREFLITDVTTLMTRKKVLSHLA